MYTYGQYCPVAMATEILGERWTLLIVRDLLTGTRHFNDLERSLPEFHVGCWPTGCVASNEQG